MAVNRDTRRSPVSPFDATEREQTDTLLRDLGADDVVIEVVATRIEDDEVQSVVSRLRAFAEANPRIVLGALSALIAGGAVVAGRTVAKKRSARARTRKAAPSKKAARPAKARASSKRTLIEPHPGDKRYVRRDARGRIKESDDVGRSLAADRRRTSKKRSKPGQ
ncbi:MAG TPA: hypothetical protein VF057_13280, partial [Thermoanaerobaculia bacterium]